MKKLLLGLCAILLLTEAQAGSTDSLLVLTLTNIKSSPNFAGRDYLRNIVIGSSTLPNFNATSRFTNWDLRGKLVYDTTTFPVKTRFTALVPSKYADSIPHKLGQIFFYGDNLTDLDITNGLYSMSEALDSQNVYTPRTTTGTDTLVIDDVTNSYMNGTGTGYAYYHQMTGFPMRDSAAWHNDYTHTVSFLLSDYLLGYNSTPGKIYFHNTTSDSIVAYGLISMVMPNHDTALRIPVLQDKVITSETDSFTINGSPFPSALLTVLGVTQGMTANTYSYCFYRAGRLTTPLMQVWYTDGSFTTVSKIWVDTDYVATLNNSTAVPEVTSVNDMITVYPNPVINRMVNIDVRAANATGTWTCELISITGQKVAIGNLSLASGHTQLNIPAALAAGNYYLRLYNDSKPVSVKPLTIK